MDSADTRNAIITLGIAFLFFAFLTTVVIQTNTTTRAKIAAGYTEVYVPYSTVHVWQKK